VNGSLNFVATPNPDRKQTGYALYRSKRGAAPGTNFGEYSLIERFPANSDNTATTAYSDLNKFLPGRSPIYLFNMNPKSIALAQLQTAQSVDLGLINSLVYRWIVYMFAALQLAIPQHHFVIENWISPESDWQPFY